MARRRRRVVGKPVVDEELDELEGFEDEELDIEDPEEEEDEKPVVRRRRRVVEPDDDDEATPVTKRSKARKVVADADVDVADNDVLKGDIFQELVEKLADGQVLIVTRRGRNSWSVVVSDSEKVGFGNKLSGKEYWLEVANPDYLKFDEEWSTLTFAEKVKRAKELGCEWESHEDPRVEAMRIKPAVTDKLGVEKYKEQYRSRAARAAIRA